ncbi:MAG: hypothetical protein AAE984_01270 [Cuniculiplasma divulgatum]|jgi:hypothetical protein
MFLVDKKCVLENSGKAVPNQLSKFIQPLNEKTTLFPVVASSSIDKGIKIIFTINSLQSSFIKGQFAITVPSIFSGRRDALNITTILENKLISIRPKLRKRYRNVPNFSEILDSMIEELTLDMDFRDKIINLKEEQFLNVFSKLLALRLMQATFEKLDEKDKINFKKEALRRSKFG